MDLVGLCQGLGWKTKLAVCSLLLCLCLGCGPSDEEVARAAEEAGTRLAKVLLSNTSCSLSEAFSGGGTATATLERYTDRMEEETGPLSDYSADSNRDKMRVISRMNTLAEDWENDLKDIGCEVSNAD